MKAKLYIKKEVKTFFFYLLLTDFIDVKKEKEEEVVYKAIVLENEESSLSDEMYSPQHSPVYRKSYMTRSNKKLKKEEFSEEEYDDRYEEESFQDDEYSDDGESVLVAQQVKQKAKKEVEKKPPPAPQLKKKPNGEVKRTRKFALPWTAAESKTLAMLVNLYGAKEWQFVAKILQSKHNNNRTAAQCSQVRSFSQSYSSSFYFVLKIQRWCRVINPAINKGPWDAREDKLLCEKFDDLQGSLSSFP